jgi:hypothetical protein
MRKSLESTGKGSIDDVMLQIQRTPMRPEPLPEKMQYIGTKESVDWDKHCQDQIETFTRKVAAKKI